MTGDPFAPLNGAGAHPTAPPRGAWTNVAPVPADAPAPPASHPKIGKASGIWAYRDAAGALLGFICRFDGKEGKQFRPLAFWRRDRDGAQEWRWEAWPTPRPLYGLDRLAAQPHAPVLLVEGEKSADAAQRLAPDHVAVTSPNGAKSAGKADWTALAGRDVVIWPDADEAGRKYAATVAALVQAAGARSVAAIPIALDAYDGFDAFDAEAEGWDHGRVAAFIATAAMEPAAATVGGRADGKPRRTPQRDVLIEIGDKAAFWHSPDGVAYATIPVNGHRENWKVRSARFKNWLTGEAIDRIGRSAPGGQAVEDALRFFEAVAINRNPERTPWLRVGDGGDR